MTKLLTVIATLCLTTALAGPLQAKELFKAKLSGGNEVPPVETDTSGRAFLRLNNSETRFEITLRVRDGEDITQAHIHCAPEGSNGAVVVFLAGLNVMGHDVDGKWISEASFESDDIINDACGATTEELAQSMRDGLAYVNVHSVINPRGEIRGQLK